MAMSDRNKHRVGMRKVVRVTPTLETSEYATNDVMINSTEIPDAAAYNGGCGKLIGFGFIDYSDQTLLDFNIRFTTKQQNFGARNSAVSISDPDLRTAGLCGHYIVDSSTFDVDNVGSQSVTYVNTSSTQVGPILLQADTNSTSAYFTIELTSSAITYSADDLEFFFMIEY
tara:strand:+ start:1385 stop:1897 length:513 start_codon:yes stop_codon:yes gene_type:complete